METKTNAIKAAIDSGNAKKAISIASKFFDRSADTQLFKDAQSALLHPSFYRQIGKDPEVIVAAATARLTERFA